MSITFSRHWLYAVAFPFCLVILPVFVDMAYGALGGAGRAGLFSVGVLFRGGLTVLAFYLVLRLRACPLKAPLLVFFVIFLFSNLVWALASDVYSLAHELSQGMKVSFPWLVAGIFLYLDRQARIQPFYLLSLMAWAGLLSASSILAGAALGVGHQTYGDWSYGSKGFFNAQNDIGLTLLLTLVASVVVLVQTRKLVHLVITGVIAIAGLLLGTRTGVLGPVGVVVAFSLAALLNRRIFRPAAGRGGWKATAVLVVPVLVAATVGAAIFSHADKTQYVTKRIESLAEETPRSRLEAAGAKRLRSRGLIFTLFGDGGLAFKKHVAENTGRLRQNKIDLGAAAALGQSVKLDFPVQRVENDIFDVLGFYGVLQFTVVYGGLAFVYILAWRRAFRAWNVENVGMLLILTFFLGHSSLAGHAVFSPQVATVLAPVIFLQLRDLQWGRRRAVQEDRPIGVADQPEASRG